MEHVLYIIIGIALAASCGFRVFVPLLIASIAIHSGHLTPAMDFLWLGSWAAIISLAVATILEIVAYYVPWLDNILDTISTPAAIIAGTLVTASFISTMTPLMRWSLAVIAGGGIAGVIQGTTVSLRGLSSAVTGGSANPVVSTVEAISSIVLSIVSIILPVLGIILVVLILVGLTILFFKMKKRKKLGII